MKLVAFSFRFAINLSASFIVALHCQMIFYVKWEFFFHSFQCAIPLSKYGNICIRIVSFFWLRQGLFSQIPASNFKRKKPTCAVLHLRTLITRRETKVSWWEIILEPNRMAEQDNVSELSFHTANGDGVDGGNECNHRNCFQSIFDLMTCGIGNGSHIVWVTCCAAIAIIFCLLIYLAKEKMANENVPYLYLILLMTISAAGQGYCLYYRNSNDFVIYDQAENRISDGYVLAGLYIFGIGTLLSITVNLAIYTHAGFLLHNCFSESHSDWHAKVQGNFFRNSQNSSNTTFIYVYGGICNSSLAYESFRLVFVLLQLAFIQKFRNAIFMFSSKIRFALYQTLMTNICIWFKYVFDETNLFGGVEPVFSAPDEFVITAEQFKEILTPFILEFSLIAAGVFSNMSSRLTIPNGQYEGGGMPNRQEVVAERMQNHIMRVDGTQPGLLIGAFLGLLTISLGIMFGNNDSRISETSKEIFLVAELLVAVCQLIAVFFILCFIFEHERVDHNKKVSDDVLLAIGFLGTFAFDFVVFYGVSKSISRHSNAAFANDKHRNPFQKRDDITTAFQISVLLLSQFFQLVGIAAIFRRFKCRYELNSSGYIRQATLFLMVTNLCFWVIDSFIEMKDHVAKSYYSASKNFKGWNTLIAMTFPFCVFFRFHAAGLLFQFWQRFMFVNAD